VLAGLTAASAQGERIRDGDVIVSLDGKLSPLVLPRDRPAPVSVRLRAGVEAAGEAALPRVTGIEFGLPGAATVRTKGLPTCPLRAIRDATRARALAVCGKALVGRGRLLAQVNLPNQDPFVTKARVLAFNGRIGGTRAIVVHAFSPRPLSVTVLPFFFGKDKGLFGTRLSARIGPSLGPWPRLARLEMTIGRRYVYRGRSVGYLSASCPLPKQQTAGYISLARVRFDFAGRAPLTTEITRTCRAN
jgi:hypothetical protein